MIDKLPRELVEEGRAHPFVEELCRELKKAHVDMLHKLEEKAAAGESDGALNALGGRCAAFREVLRIITTAEGDDE